MEEFDIEFQWQQYLQLVGLSLDSMHPTQIIETKRAFIAGMGQLFVLFGMDQDEEAAEIALNKMFNQIKAFWANEEIQL